MYHLYKAFAESEADILKTQHAYASEEHGVTVPYTTVLTLSPGFFRDELELGVRICGCEDSLKDSEVMAFSTLVFNPLLDLLEEYAKADLVGAQVAAAEMIRILESIDTDDDMFPEYEIGLIRDAVSLSPEQLESSAAKALTEFMEGPFVCDWKGFAVWDAGNGTVDCNYEAHIVLKPTDGVRENDVLKQLLRGNPSASGEVIHNFFVKRLCGYLDDEFEEYCSDDDYYQPVVEDFELEYRVKNWCRQNAFDFVSCEGHGDDDGYVPKFRGGRW